jgi:hypothetical protein
LSLTADRPLNEDLPPDVSDRLLKLELRRAQLEVQELRQNNFLAFVKHVWPEFIAGNHHKIMADAFERVARGELKRLIVNMAPRHTKSEFSSYLLPAWMMGRAPALKVIEATHTAELATGFGRKVKNLIDSKAFKEVFPEVSLSADSKASGRWNTDKGGEYFALGVGGAMAGRGASLCLLKGTLVEINGEATRIEQVRPGDSITTHYGRQRVTKFKLTTHNHGVKINSGLTASGSHPFMTSSGWVEAGDLTAGSKILTTTLWRRAWLRASFLLKCLPTRHGKA